MISEDRVYYFRKLCMYRNFTKAAEHMYMSQPTLSRQIRLLEEELGFDLIDRRTKKFRLTSAGEAFLNMADEYSFQQSLFQERISQLSADYRKLTVGFSPGLTISPLVKASQIMLDKNPSLKMDFQAYPQSQLPQMVLADRIDCAFAFNGELSGFSELKLQIIGENYIAIIMSKNHPLWGRKSVRIEELKDFQITITEQEFCPLAYDATIKYLNKHGVRLYENHYESCPEKQILRVLSGEFISLSNMYNSELFSYEPSLFACIPIIDSNIHYGDLTLAYRSHTHEIDEFIKCLKKTTPRIKIVDDYPGDDKKAGHL